MNYFVTAYGGNLEYNGTNCLEKSILFSAPPFCPLCNIRNRPIIVSENFLRERAYIFFICSNCDSSFLGIYTFNPLPENETPVNPFPTYPLSLEKLFPNQLHYEEFPEIQTFSPSFAIIYSQTLSAEKEGLTELTGMGFRKALEFLVRDYLVFLEPEKEEDIRKLTFANCIKKLDTDLQEVADGANWLSNDFVHYTKMHHEFNIEDLKEFIDLFVAKIQAKVAEKNAIDKIQAMREKRESRVTKK